MALEQFPESIRNTYEMHEWRHASAVLATDFPDEFANLVKVLSEFKLNSSFIVVGGGNKGPVAKALDKALVAEGWDVKNFDTQLVLDGTPIDSPTHEIDCFKAGVALEIEWNNKDPFFDRDLNNFRLLFELRAISVGIIITRCTHLHERTFNGLPKKIRAKYGASTTHMGKLLPKLNGGGGGGCPIIAIGIGENRWNEDIPIEKVDAVLVRLEEIKLANKGVRLAKRQVPENLRFLDGIDLAPMLGLLAEAEEAEE